MIKSSVSFGFPRLMLLIFSGFGLFAGAKLTIEHISIGETCPLLGSVPACYVVAAGYFLIFVSALMIMHSKARSIFYLGWLPVMGLALTGVIFELVRGSTCPPGALGIPQCFYSLAMALLCWVLFRLARRMASN